MSTSGAVLLTGGWIVYALNPPRVWVCILLFGAAILTFIIDGLIGGTREH